MGPSPAGEGSDRCRVWGARVKAGPRGGLRLTRSAPGWPQGAAGLVRPLRAAGPRPGLPATAEAEERRVSTPGAVAERVTGRLPGARSVPALDPKENDSAPPGLTRPPGGPVPSLPDPPLSARQQPRAPRPPRSAVPAGTRASGSRPGAAFAPRAAFGLHSTAARRERGTGAAQAGEGGPSAVAVPVAASRSPR